MKRYWGPFIEGTFFIHKWLKISRPKGLIDHLSAMITLLFFWLNSLAIYKPMPLAAPVVKMVFPDVFIVLLEI
jgi:hypothetical protein